MHQHVNDEILSYISSGVTHHRDSAGFKSADCTREINDDDIVVNEDATLVLVFVDMNSQCLWTGQLVG